MSPGQYVELAGRGRAWQPNTLLDQPPVELRCDILDAYGLATASVKERRLAPTVVGVRSEAMPGDEDFRSGDRRIHGADWCFCPPTQIKGFVADLDGYLAGPEPALIRAAVGAFQLVSIHPWTDGNGRTMRRLINATLGTNLALDEWFHRRRTLYCWTLQYARDTGDLLPWFGLCFDAVASADEEKPRRKDGEDAKRRRERSTGDYSGGSCGGGPAGYSSCNQNPPQSWDGYSC